MIADHTDRPLAELLSLKGKTAVVTGAGRGIGAATARRLAEAGAHVVVADLDRTRAEQTAAALTARGWHAASAGVDVADTTTLAALAEAAVADTGRLDVWVNNAGIFPTTGPALEATDAFVDRMLEVNVRGTYAGAREAAKRMHSGGVIVNVASTTGLRAAPGISAYVASKHAVVGVTKALALELGPLDIRVVGVAPGVIDTPGVQDQLGPLRDAGLDVGATMASRLLGRVGQPDDVARVITVLASDLAAWITGSVVPVDAGALAGG